MAGILGTRRDALVRAEIFVTFLIETKILRDFYGLGKFFGINFIKCLHVVDKCLAGCILVCLRYKKGRLGRQDKSRWRGSILDLFRMFRRCGIEKRTIESWSMRGICVGRTDLGSHYCRSKFVG